MSLSYRALLLLTLLSLPLPRLHAGPVEDGEEAMRKGQAATALRYFKIAIQANPDDERAWSGYRRATLANQGKSSGEATPPVAAPAAVPVMATPVAATPAEDSNATPAEVANRYLKGEPLFYSKPLEKLLERPLKPKLRIEKDIYDREKETLTRYYQRKRGGSMQVSATLFTPVLYTYLARVRANEAKLGSAGAKELWLKEADKSFRTLEFYLVFKNLTYAGGIQAERRNIDFTDVEKRVFLEDDRGVRYEPYQTEPPKTDLLVDQDSMTVWFAPISRNGTPVWEGAVSELRLVIEDVEGEARRIAFPFPKSTFRRMVQVEL